MIDEVCISGTRCDRNVVREHNEAAYLSVISPKLCTVNTDTVSIEEITSTLGLVSKLLFESNATSTEMKIQPYIFIN